MISELCAELRNYFLRDYVNPEQYMHSGSFVIANGEMQSLPFLKFGQYYRIVGSTFNDGVHKYSANHRGTEDSETLIDEEFEGTIWEMFVPKEVVDLSAEIQDWVSKMRTPSTARISPSHSAATVTQKPLQAPESCPRIGSPILQGNLTVGGG